MKEPICIPGNQAFLTVVSVVALMFSSLTCCAVEIAQVEPTLLYPRQQDGQPLRQQANLRLNNPGKPIAATMRITVGTLPPETQDAGTLRAGGSVVTIRIRDIAAPTPVKIEVVDKGGNVLATRQQEWQPGKKWTVYYCAYSHQDFGFGDYPHRIRTSIRHKNFTDALKYCRDTDALPEADRYRYNFETSQALTTYVGFNGKDAARELAQRIREGRLELSGLHNTVMTEELGSEMMARLFYMSGRHAPDLLGAPATRTAQNTDVIGLTWAFASYCREADMRLQFSGNGLAHTFLPAENDVVFHWQGPGGQSVLMNDTPYGGCDFVARLWAVIQRTSRNNPDLTVALVQDSCDFTGAELGMDTVRDVRAWNAKWAYPKAVCGTFDMYFDAVEKCDVGKLKMNRGDINDEWSAMVGSTARMSGEARRVNNTLPDTETLSTFAQSVAGGGDQWLNAFQGYNRLLQFWEHTHGRESYWEVTWYRNHKHPSFIPVGVSAEDFRWYETEFKEMQEMVSEADGYREKMFANSTRCLEKAITRGGDKNLVVFNPLPQSRTDIVRAVIPAGRVVDSVTGATIPVQQLADGTAIFVAPDVPATGYKVFSLLDSSKVDADLRAEPDRARRTRSTEDQLENKFYRLRVDPVTGALASLFDKALGVEIIESNAPHAFNQYLYEFRKQIVGKNPPRGVRNNPPSVITDIFSKTYFDSTWSHMGKATQVSVVRGPVADILAVTGEAGGVRQLKQTLTLYHDFNRIDFQLWLDKLPFAGNYWNQKEAAFVALPFNVPGFTIHHELPGCVIEPYKDQAYGSTTAHYAIQSFTDLSNDKYGITVSPIEGSLVCYGEPTSTPILMNYENGFKTDRTYPAKSRLYLYLLNNMWDMNNAVDQQGPINFSWALRSHSGDWKTSGADRFGHSVQQPLMAWRADGKNNGPLPVSASFMSVDAANVACSVVKQAEMNGRGFIIRLNETAGQETVATVTLPLLPEIESARATSLVENDRPEQYPVAGNSFKLTMPKFSIKTVRVTFADTMPAVGAIQAVPVADKWVNLTWKADGASCSHVNIYRDTDPKCALTQLNFIGQSADGCYADIPRLHLGGWLRSCLAPATTYYYRLVPVDRYNNPGTPSATVAVTTLASAQANLPPVAVEALSAIPVSPLSPKFNFVNLLFRTACEPDVVGYEIHRGTKPDFAAGAGSLVGTVNSEDKVPSSGGSAERGRIFKVKEYDHATYADMTVKAATTYYYKVRAVDAAGQKGAFSEEVSISTK